VRLVVAITGATGAVFGVRLLEVLRELAVETELCISRWGARTLEHETSLSVADVQALATRAYSAMDHSAPISSGSYPTDGMIIAPCSMRTVAAIAHGMSDNLVQRAADVVLKERRRLVIVAREMPLSEIHLENLLRLARIGVTVMPPVPAFYAHPTSVADIVDHVVMRALDQFGLRVESQPRWNGALLRRVTADSDA
jgi:4-hydroxy-3-polyprenylbenzoate decarboxylase